MIDQHLQHAPRRSRNLLVSRIRQPHRQLRDLVRSLRGDDAKFREMATQGIDQLRLLADQGLPDPVDDQRALLLLIGTKRMLGRWTASQTASASA